MVLSSLINTCSDGPAVSLKGSPTVSPTTLALCVSDRLPPYTPVSMYFLALSHAPPPVLRKIAMMTPVMVAIIRNAAIASAPSLNERNIEPDRNREAHDQRARRDHLLERADRHDVNGGPVVGRIRRPA